MQFLVIKKQTVILTLIALIGIVSASLWFYYGSDAVTAVNLEKSGKIREIHMITSEFKTTTADGRVKDSYRWDPGTIVVEKDEKVRLIILGFNGKEHPFIIEGTEYKGTIKKGEETILDVQFNKDGVYRLICLTHSSKDTSGPMIGYIVVD